MLVVPKTVVPLYTLQNPLVRYDFGRGLGDFNWVGLCQMRSKDSLAGPCRTIFNVRHLWEVVVVEPTRDPDTEDLRTVTADTVVPTDAVEAITGGSRITLTWTDIQVDLTDGAPTADLLTVVVTIDLMDDEAFLRTRIATYWSRNNPSTSAGPGKWAIWRVRFPIIDVTPNSGNSFGEAGEPCDIEFDDALFVPEAQGVVIEAPTACAGADPDLGVWAPQDRATTVRNVTRPGGHWRQHYPGKASSQVLGYYGRTSGHGVLVGCLDAAGHLKEFSAGGGEGSVWFEVLQVPFWVYTVGNRPAGFTGSTVGDHTNTFRQLGTHLPQSQQTLPDLVALGPAPNARDIVVGGPVSPDLFTANEGMMLLGLVDLGISGVDTNTLLNLGYESPYDTVVAPTMAFGPHGWTGLSKAWRAIADIPESAFPLRQKELNGELPAGATARAALLEVDATIHEGQITLDGMDEPGFPEAYAAEEGVITDTQAIRDLIVPQELSAARLATNAIDVIEAGTEHVSVELLGAAGAAGAVSNDDTVGETGRGYMRVYGAEGFYVAPVQVIEDDWFGGFASLGALTFEDFLPVDRGVKVGDVIRVVSSLSSVFEPNIGRAGGVVASDSEVYPASSNGDQARVVMGFGVSADTLIVGRYVAGELVQHTFSPVLGNTPGYHFEVEILREEFNTKLQFPTLVDGKVRAEVRVVNTVINECYPESSLGWAEVVEVEGVEYTFRRLYSDVAFGFIEFDPGDKDASYFNGKGARLRRRISPVDFVALGAAEGDHVILEGVEINERDRVIEFGTNDTAAALLSDGWLGFERPVVFEAPDPADPFVVKLYAPASSAGRLLGPDDDLVGLGRRFVDTAFPAAGGFAAVVQAGDVLEVTDATEASNLLPFTIVEVPSESELIVDRDFVTEAPGGSAFTYRILRRGRALRLVRGGRRGFRALRSGPRRVLADGRDQVHFLAAGYLVDPAAEITGVFGVDSEAWADLGANPFVPATSINLTTYRTNSRGIRKPSQVFVIDELVGSLLLLERGWELEDSTFDVTFSDIGLTTFEKNAIQFRIVRDDRAVEAYDYDDTAAAINAWKDALETEALFVLIRGWQPKILGWDQPDFRPPRGRYLEMIAALDADVATAIDPHHVRPDDEDGLAEEFNLAGAAYFNRFGSRTAQVSAGDVATGEQDDLVHPGVSHARDYVVQRVLGLLASDGVERFLLDRIEEAPREQFGSPHFFRPLRTEGGLDVEPGDPTTFEPTAHGGSADFAQGWRTVLSRVAAGYAVTSPADWLLGFADYSSKDWGDIDRSFPDALLAMPITGTTIVPLAGAVIVLNDLTLTGQDFSAMTATLYGRDQVIKVDDEVVLLPSGNRHVIAAVGESLTLEDEPSIGADTHFEVRLHRNVSHECIIGASFFNFAFGPYATVAADVTFLANDISWEEVTGKIGSSITRVDYDRAVSGALRRSLYRIGVNGIHGLIPSIKVQSESKSRVPPDRYGTQWSRRGTRSLLDQRGVDFSVGLSTSELVESHLLYLRTLSGRISALPTFFRTGAQDHSPPVTGATSLQIDGVALGRGGEQPVVQSAAFRDDTGDFIMAFTHWAPPLAGGSVLETVATSYTFSEREISTGYWTVVEERLNQANVWQGTVHDVPVAPATVHPLSFDIGYFQSRLFLVYEQTVEVRLDESSVEVDRALEVLPGRSVAAAFATIALDVVKGGSGNYVVVVHEGAIADGLDIPSIPGATISMQRAADENPTIGETE